MLCKVIKEFRYAEPGDIYGKLLPVGKEREFPDKTAEALKKEGYLQDASPAATPSPQSNADASTAINSEAPADAAPAASGEPASARKARKQG